jgi:hypothetical protein
MSDDYYFDGDPSTDSARRHLERVLREPPRRRRWPWILAAVAGATAWYFWPRGSARPAGAESNSQESPPR